MSITDPMTDTERDAMLREGQEHLDRFYEVSSRLARAGVSTRIVVLFGEDSSYPSGMLFTAEAAPEIGTDPNSQGEQPAEQLSMDLSPSPINAQEV